MIRHISCIQTGADTGGWNTQHPKVPQNTRNTRPQFDLEWPLTRFQGHDIFRHWISQKRHEIEPWYYRTSIGSRMRSIERWYFQWPRWTLTRFSRSRYFWSWISQKRCLLGAKLLKNTNSEKPYTIYGMVPLSMTFQGHCKQRYTIDCIPHPFSSP